MVLIIETVSIIANINIGAYWATFDPNQRRKRGKAQDDFHAEDKSMSSFGGNYLSKCYLEYWEKRNARATVKKNLVVLTDDQVEKRLERQKQLKEEKDRKDEEEQERLQKKLDESMIGKEIYQGIYLGSKHAAKNLEFFEKCSVKSVVNMTTEIKNYHESNGIEYLK